MRGTGLAFSPISRTRIYVATLAIVVATPSPAAETPACRQIAFAGNLKAGDGFVQEIGAGLVLRLRPEALAEPAAGESKSPDGWRLTLEPVSNEPKRGVHDYIYPVNPPLRFNPKQDIGTSYGYTAKEKLGDGAIAYRFILSDPDYARIDPLLQAALWPYTAKDPEHADENYAMAIEALTTGLIRFRPTKYDLSANGERIRHLAFTVEVTAPQDFAFLPALAPKPAACPAKDD
jgi:hypothetical protein